MERSLPSTPEPAPIPSGFWLIPWQDRWSDLHADVLFRSFVDDRDGQVFPNLATVCGCREVMRVVRGLPGFCPLASWLLAGPDGYAGAIQGVVDSAGHGAIQNLGVMPKCRGVGLGAVLLTQALTGFRQAGATWCHLEVTADNDPAVRLYQRCGFRKTRVIYKSVLVPDAGVVGVGV
jgi:hypothetical protein